MSSDPMDTLVDLDPPVFREIMLRALHLLREEYPMPYIVFSIAFAKVAIDMLREDDEDDAL